MSGAPDLSQFVRGSYSLRAIYGQTFSSALEAYVYRVVNQETDPRLVPFFALEAMGTHPVVYLAERMITGVVRRSDLFSIVHSDPKVKAAHEEWLWRPRMLPRLLNAYARAYAYGEYGVIFDVARSTLRTRVPSGDAGAMRAKNRENFTHYSDVHEVRPSEVEREFESDRLAWLRYAGASYKADRARYLLWDAEGGDIRGQGARRRAWRDYCESLVINQLECNYLERSVDSPRVATAPAGSQEDPNTGQRVANSHLVNQLLIALRGSGAVTFPSSFDDKGNALYDVKTLDLPDREQVWTQAITRREARMMISYLALVGGVTADSTSAASKTLDGVLKEFVQDLAEWIAADLTELVGIVHGWNYDPERVPLPLVVATDVGKTNAKKMLVEVLRIVGGEQVARWVDVSTALDRLQVPVLEQPLEAKPAASPAAGRPLDVTSDREERREDAREEEGEDDTGGEDTDREEQPE